jgi:tetratricopeptide (TPR) repeat protein
MSHAYSYSIPHGRLEWFSGAGSIERMNTRLMAIVAASATAGVVAAQSVGDASAGSAPDPLASVDDAVGRIRSSYDEIRLRFADKERQLRQAIVAQQAAEARCGAAEAMLKESEADRKSLRERAQRLEDELSRARDSIAGLSTTIAGLEEQVAAAQRETRHVAQERDSLHAAAGSARDRMVDAERERDRARASLAGLEARLKDLVAGAIAPPPGAVLQAVRPPLPPPESFVHPMPAVAQKPALEVAPPPAVEPPASMVTPAPRESENPPAKTAAPAIPQAILTGMPAVATSAPPSDTSAPAIAAPAPPTVVVAPPTATTAVPAAVVAPAPAVTVASPAPAAALPAAAPQIAVIAPATRPAATNAAAASAAMTSAATVEGTERILAEASSAFDSGDWARARTLYQRVLTDDPSDPVASVGLTEVLLETGETREALRRAKVLLAADPDSAHRLFLAGRAATRNGENDEALSLLERAMAVAPGNPDVKREMGAVLFDLRRFREAAETFVAATRLDSKDGESWFNACAALLMSDPAPIKLALEYYEKALSLGEPRDERIEKRFRPEPSLAAPR